VFVRILENRGHSDVHLRDPREVNGEYRAALRRYCNRARLLVQSVADRGAPPWQQP